MPMHLGTTGGLIAGGIITIIAGLKARREGWAVGDSMQGVWTGYSFTKEDWDWTRPTATYAVVGGGIATAVAKKDPLQRRHPDGMERLR